MQYVPVDALGPCLHNKVRRVGVTRSPLMECVWPLIARLQDLPPEFADHPFFGPQQFGGSMRNKQIIFSDYKALAFLLLSRAYFE